MEVKKKQKEEFSKYDFRLIEKKQQVFWEEQKLYKFDPAEVDNFVIDTPPPTISGALHIGHIFSYCHTDFIARYKRLRGCNVLYPIGFDNNGLPTERLVEKNLKIKASKLERENFTSLCKQVCESAKKEFKSLFKKIALSVDWDYEYETISDEVKKLSQQSFIVLYNKKLLYRKIQPMFWDVVDQTAIAQSEVEEKEKDSFMNYINFFEENSNEELQIATTRPEMLSACVALFFNPEDQRYKHLKGKNAKSPIFNKLVPILEDELVKIDKGTGLVMCCTFGDELDLEWCDKHKLPYIDLIDKFGKLNIKDDISKELNGLKVVQAREKIIEILKKEGFLKKQEKISHFVKCAERSGSQLEILPSYQWYIKVVDFKKEFLEFASNCNWYPQSAFNKIKIWIDSLKWDWCISRQRYFGVPIPVWYDKKAEKIIVPSLGELPVDPQKDTPRGYKKEELIGDIDVMDTWATSSLTPYINAKNIVSEGNLDTNKLFPADLRTQAHEIIRTWAFYTIVKSYFHSNSIPWKNIMISGWCLSKDKDKMSKSKGNVILPEKILNHYGVDVVRYWASHSNLGVDTVYSEDVFKIGKKLINKIWNAAKFVFSFNLENVAKEDIKNPLDLWILYKLDVVIKATENVFDVFEYNTARNFVEDFFMKDFCDNYIELVKARAYGVKNIENISAISTLYYVLKNILILFSPFFPYVTEEIYNSIYLKESIHKKDNWPKLFNIEESYYEVGNRAVSILKNVREFKSSKNISIKFLIQKIVISTNCKELQKLEYDLKNSCNVKALEWDFQDISQDMVKCIL